METLFFKLLYQGALYPVVAGSVKMDDLYRGPGPTLMN